MREFIIGERIITQDTRPFIIAEIGPNHNGSLKLCKTLIQRAKANGADSVKLQKRCPEKLYTRKFFDSPYGDGRTYGEHKLLLEFNEDEWSELFRFANELDIMLFATPFDLESVIFLKQFNPPAYKIASACLTDIPLIGAIADLGKPMIFSTGGATWDDIDRIYGLFWDVSICFLHCVASYPTRANEMNLAAIPSMLERYPDIILGLSDHYQGWMMAMAAYCLGARVFEKHFTTDHTLPGPDHALSLEPHELGQWVHEMERLRVAMGTGEKTPLPCEANGIYKMGHSVYTSKALQAGKVIERGDLTIKSPAEGLPPYEIDNLIGKMTKYDISEEYPLTWRDIE